MPTQVVLEHGHKTSSRPDSGFVAPTTLTKSWNEGEPRVVAAHVRARAPLRTTPGTRTASGATTRPPPKTARRESPPPPPPPRGLRLRLVGARERLRGGAHHALRGERRGRGDRDATSGTPPSKSFVAVVASALPTPPIRRAPSPPAPPLAHPRRPSPGRRTGGVASPASPIAPALQKRQPVCPMREPAERHAGLVEHLRPGGGVRAGSQAPAAQRESKEGTLDA